MTDRPAARVARPDEFLDDLTARYPVLTPVRSDLVDAPYAEEFPVVLECRLLQTIELGIHTQFIGEIVDVKGDPEVFGEDGQLDIMKIKPLVYDPSHKGYHGVGPLLGKAFSVGNGLKK